MILLQNKPNHNTDEGSKEAPNRNNKSFIENGGYPVRKQD
jgi:hypothetical protein